MSKTRDAERLSWPPDCPRPPQTLEDLPFERRPMVDWLAPTQLASTGIKALLSSIFGAYADKREIQAALHPDLGTGDEAYDGVYGMGDDGFWLDYCADLGDGFNSTYAVARVMSRPGLRVPGVPRVLPRGNLLILGGDEVYPTATRQEYQDRFVGPYQAAFSWGPPERSPHLFAIPGNHDWYDGLTSFTRLFCQRRWIGGWKTRQRRSYFALRLPAGWWLWGTDIQLESDIDQPQVLFFQHIARQMRDEADRAATGDPPRLILCTAQPSWVYCDSADPSSRHPPRGGCRLPVEPERYAALEYFQREIIFRFGIRLVALLSGDLHHFTYYRAETPTEGGGPEHLVTSGGGGAYLYPTHHMPERLTLPESRRSAAGELDRTTREYERQAIFPPSEDSRRLGRLSWLKLPWRNRSFAVLLAAVYLLYAWMTQSASKSINSLFADWWPDNADVPGSIMQLLARLGWREFPSLMRAFWDVLRHSPSGVVFALVVVFGLWQFRHTAGRSMWKGVSGAVHGLAHLLLCFVLMWLSSWLNLTVFELRLESPLQVVLFFLEMLIAGGLLGGWLFGLYMMITSRFSGAHMNEVFSSQSLESFKNFLRLHIGTDGKITLYPLGIRQVPALEQWKYRGGGDDDDLKLGPGEPWFDPPGGGTPVELIEGKPIELS